MAPPRRVFAALTASALLMLLSLTVLASNAPASQPLDRRGSVIISPSATNNFDQLVVVLMENKNLNEVYGPAPYMTQLADQYSFSQGWSSITNPSQPNYIAIMGASTFGVGGDGNHPNLNHPTLVDLIETSCHTWNAIAEGSGSGCSFNHDRCEDHFPFLSYTTITDEARVHVDCRVQSLFAREAPARRPAPRQPRTGRRECALSARVLRRRRAGLHAHRKPGNRLVHRWAVRDVHRQPDWEWRLHGN